MKIMVDVSELIELVKLTFGEVFQFADANDTSDDYHMICDAEGGCSDQSYAVNLRNGKGDWHSDNSLTISCDKAVIYPQGVTQ